jgi:predicted transcriptional regulator
VSLRFCEARIFPSKRCCAEAPLCAMKHLKSTLPNLRELFERSITVKEIAEPLISFDAERSAVEVEKFLEERDYDVVGVRCDGVVVGCARRRDLRGGKLGDHLRPFDAAETLPETAPLLAIFEALRKRNEMFVVLLGQVGGIVTRGDLQKAPVRMWLFGLISLTEMQLLRLIRESFPGDTWKPLLSADRLHKAEKMLDQRRKTNTAIDLADCLQFGDKRIIVHKHGTLHRQMGFSSKLEGTRLLGELEKLRDRLAHSQDIIAGNWPRIVELAAQTESLLRKCEKISARSLQPPT